MSSETRHGPNSQEVMVAVCGMRGDHEWILECGSYGLRVAGVVCVWQVGLACGRCGLRLGYLMVQHALEHEHEAGSIHEALRHEVLPHRVHFVLELHQLLDVLSQHHADGLVRYLARIHTGEWANDQPRDWCLCNLSFCEL